MIGMGLLKVELRAHTGEHKQYDNAGNFLGTFVQVFDQWQIYVKAPDAPRPFRFGYVGKKPGAPINALVTLPPEIVAEIQSEVRRLLAEKSGVQESAERKLFNPTGFPVIADDDSDVDNEDFDSEDLE